MIRPKRKNVTFIRAVGNVNVTFIRAVGNVNVTFIRAVGNVNGLSQMRG